MAWDFERSKKRLQDEWARIQKAGIAVKPLTREMDLSNLSLADTRLVTGVHLYTDIRNIDELLLDPLQRRDDYRRVYRTLQLTRVELRRILQSVFRGDKIQAQGPKFHGLIFRPYGDPESMAEDAVLAGLAIYAALTEAFSSVFDAYPALVPSIGMELGDCLVANIGMRGDRELISIGNAANAAAKIMAGGEHALTIGKDLYDHLDDDHQAWFSSAPESYRLDAREVDDIEERVRDAGFSWSMQSSADHFQAGKDNLSLDDIAIEEVREKIDIDRLSPTRGKTCPAASIFTDIDGYTALVASMDGDTEELTKAVQAVHLFRYELRQVTENDYAGIALQHQGDRLQVVFHLPGEDDEEVMQRAVDICIGHNSSVEEVLNINHEIVGKLHIAIGCAFGKAVVGKLGVRGDRDPVCLGTATVAAESIQLALPGNSMGLSKTVYDEITDTDVKEWLSWDKAYQCYVAHGVTFVKIEDAADAKAYETAKCVGYGGAGMIAIARQAPAVRPLKVTRPFCS